MTAHPSLHRSALAGAAGLLIGLAGCNSRPEPVAATAPAAKPSSTPAARAFTGSVLNANGQCEGTPSGAAVSIELGMGECDLVRLKGKPPTDVLVGEGGRGSREVQVHYSEPTRRALYFFVHDRLDRIVK